MCGAHRKWSERGEGEGRRERGCQRMWRARRGPSGCWRGGKAERNGGRANDWLECETSRASLDQERGREGNWGWEEKEGALGWMVVWLCLRERGERGWTRWQHACRQGGPRRATDSAAAGRRLRFACRRVDASPQHRPSSQWQSRNAKKKQNSTHEVEKEIPGRSLSSDETPRRMASAPCSSMPIGPAPNGRKSQRHRKK